MNEDGKLEAVPDNHNNTNNKFSVEEMTDPMNQFEFTLYILNQYYVPVNTGGLMEFALVLGRKRFF